MSRLVRLYPCAWREKYGVEFAGLLAERPPTLLERFDIARGAVDAWLHPQVLGTASGRPDGEPTVDARVARAGAILGGTIWILGGLPVNFTPTDPEIGYKNSTLGVGLLVAGVLVTALAALVMSRALPGSSHLGQLAPAVMLLGAVLMLMPWPVLLIGFFGYALATIAFGAILAFSAGYGMGGLLALGAIFLPSLNVEDERSLLAIPFGLAWIAVGAFAFRRASAPAPA
jgi:hypothetical protein